MAYVRGPMTWIVVTALASVTASPAPARAETKLSGRQQRWLDEDVVHIVSDYERRVFLALPDQRTRTIFISEFWTARDPSPETRRNEGRELHRRRTDQAQRLFGGDRSRPGWSTPRGRILIQLGAPDDRRIYQPGEGLLEIEDWLYARPVLPGLPWTFHVLFYRGRGEPAFRLYDPVLDGPAALVEADSGTPLEVLAATSEELAGLASCLVPGLAPADRRAQRLVERISGLHNRLAVDVSYAQRLADEAEIDPKFHDIGLAAYLHGALDRADAGLLHVAVQVPPDSLTLVADGKVLQGALDVVGMIFPAAGGAPIDVIDERIDIGLTNTEFERVKTHHFAFEDLMPVVAGDYRVQLSVRDVVTGTTALLFETVTVPVRGDGIALASPLLVSAAIPYGESTPRPFAFGRQVYYPVPGRLYSPSADIVALYEVAGPSQGGAAEKLRLRYEIVHGEEELIAGFERVSLPVGGGVAVGRIRTGLRGLPPAPYAFRLSVTRQTGERIVVEMPFEVAPQVRSVMPWVSVFDRSNTPEWRSLVRARQLRERGDLAGAVSETEAALALSPTSAEALLMLASLRTEQGESAAAYAAAERLFGGDAPTAVAALILAGRAKSVLGDPDAAARLLERASSLSPYSLLLLGELATTATAAGRTERAVAALQRSLQLKPGQKAVRDQLRRLGDER